MDTPPPSSHRRLQREKDFTGDKLSTFGDVVRRHGLPGLILALVCLAVPGLHVVLFESLERGLNAPLRYAALFILVGAGLNAYAWFIDRDWDVSKFIWIAYLGALSFWEEWVFRLALPHMFESLGAAVWVGALLSAMLFGGAHYFTLRWKWQWCVGAFIGGLALSRQMAVHEDLLLITLFHWVATSINTPRPPGHTTHGVAV